MTEMYQLRAKVLTTTDQAVLIENEGGEKHWIPLSQLEDPEPSELIRGIEQDLLIPAWLAKEKGLI